MAQQLSGYRMVQLTVVAWMLFLTLGPSITHAGGTIKIDETRSVSVGMGLRTSFNMKEDAAPNGKDWSSDFTLNSFRFYMSGQLHELVKFEFNTDFSTFDVLTPPVSIAPPVIEPGTAKTTDIRVLDGVLKFEFNDYVNVWAGRFLPPSDRSNLSGSYYLNSWEFPFVQQYPAVFVGRDDGAAIWGQIQGGQFKYQLGAFEGRGDTSTGPNQRDELLYAGRLTLNLWDPEPGYYNSSTYYGAMNVLAIGLVGMVQNDSVGTTKPGRYGGWNLDLLMERNLGNLGVATLEGAYYSYDTEGVAAEGQGYFALASYLLPNKMGAGKFQGQLQPVIRFQGFKNKGTSVGHQDRLDIGLNYVLNGHNARMTVNYAIEDPASGQEKDLLTIGLQFQI